MVNQHRYVNTRLFLGNGLVSQRTPFVDKFYPPPPTKKRLKISKKKIKKIREIGNKTRLRLNYLLTPQIIKLLKSSLSPTL